MIRPRPAKAIANSFRGVYATNLYIFSAFNFCQIESFLISSKDVDGLRGSTVLSILGGFDDITPGFSFGYLQDCFVCFPLPRLKPTLPGATASLY